MKNIFENAYFGKAYKTKDNTIVKFIIQRGEDDFSIYIPKCKYSIETTHRYNSKGEFYLGDGEYGHGALDVVSEWQEEINEEELDELAEDASYEAYQTDEYDNASRWLGYYRGFKDGYRKAKE